MSLHPFDDFILWKCDAGREFTKEEIALLLDCWNAACYEFNHKLEQVTHQLDLSCEQSIYKDGVRSY